MSYICVMWLATSIVTALVLASGVEVHSNSDCPSSDAVAGKLVLLLGGRGPGDVAWVDVTGQEPDGKLELRLRLLRADASVVAERRLILRGSCDEMADTIATVLAAWQAPPVLPPTELTAPQAKPADTAAAVPLQAWFGVAGGAALLGGLAATASLELVAERAGSPVRARVAALTQTSRQLDLEPGTVDWRRSHAELGLGWQTRGVADGSYWQVSADADVLLGWLRASGHGYSENTHEDALEYGVGAGLRGEHKLGDWAVWLEARMSAWAKPQRAVLLDSPSAARLPRFDLGVSLGVSRLVVR